MAIAANTRKFNESFIRVRNADDDGWDRFTELENFNMPGAPKAKLDASTAAGTKYRYGLPDNSDATFDYFDDLDNALLDRLNDLDESGETVTFQLVMPEGTKRMKEFTAYVVPGSLTGAYNDLWKGSFTLSVQEQEDWAVYTEDGDED